MGISSPTGWQIFWRNWKSSTGRFSSTTVGLQVSSFIQDEGCERLKDLRLVQWWLIRHFQWLFKHIHTGDTQPYLRQHLWKKKNCKVTKLGTFSFMFLNFAFSTHRNFLFVTAQLLLYFIFFCFLQPLSPTGNSPIWDIEMSEVSSTGESTHSKVKLKENPCHTSQRQRRCDESLKSG